MGLVGCWVRGFAEVLEDTCQRLLHTAGDLGIAGEDLCHREEAEVYPEAVALCLLGEGMLLHAVALADEALDAVRLLARLKYFLATTTRIAAPGRSPSRIGRMCTTIRSG